MSTQLQIKQIEHQLKTGQRTFGDKTVRVLLEIIYQQEAELKAAQAEKQVPMFKAEA